MRGHKRDGLGSHHLQHEILNGEIQGDYGGEAGAFQNGPQKSGGIGLGSGRVRNQTRGKRLKKILEVEWIDQMEQKLKDRKREMIIRNKCSHLLLSPSFITVLCGPVLMQCHLGGTLLFFLFLSHGCQLSSLFFIQLLSDVFIAPALDLVTCNNLHKAL